MVKTLNEIIQMQCHKGLSAAKIFRVLKGTVSHSGVTRKQKGSERLAAAYERSGALRVLSLKRSIKTKKLIKKFRKKLRWNPQKSTKKLAQEAHVSRSIMQRMLVYDLTVKPYKITK